MFLPKTSRFLQLTKSLLRFNSTTRESASGAPIESPEEAQRRENELQTIQEYKQALKCNLEGKYDIAEEYFKRVLKQLDVNHQYSNHLHVLKK